MGGSRLVVGVLHVSVVTGASYLAARISWHFWERRWLELRSRFEYAREPVGVDELPDPPRQPADPAPGGEPGGGPYP